MKWKHLIISLTIVLISGLVFAFTGMAQNIALAEDNGYRVEKITLSGGDYGYPSPYTHYPRGPGGYKRDLIFDSLLERDEDGLIPWLAEDYEIKDKGRKYVFTIRDDVVWHDGEPLTAEDVKFSFEYGLEHPLVWSYVSDQDIDKVEIIADNKVEITVQDVNASLLYNIGRTRIIPQHIWKDIEDQKEYQEPEAVIGTGPYQLTDYSKEHGTYLFQAFPDFWGPQQLVKTIEFVPVSEEIMAFEQEKIDLTDVSPDLLPRYENQPEYKVVQKPAFWGYRLLFNREDAEVLAEEKVRQALALAIDPEELIEKIERGAGVAGSAGIIPPDHIYYNPEVKDYGHNPQKAEELLQEAGYESLSFELTVADRTARMAELIKQQLARAGIELEIISSDTKTNDSRIDRRDFEMAITGHGGWGGEPDYLIERFAGDDLDGKLPQAGAEGYNNPELNKLLLQQKREFDEETRKELLFRIQDILAAEVPEIPLYYTAGYTVYRPDKYDGWIFMYDHHSLSHSKLSYLEKD
ncbi:MAG: ABC transporter substrate-binding protein [Bacillota bacterium]